MPIEWLLSGIAAGLLVAFATGAFTWFFTYRIETLRRHNLRTLVRAEIMQNIASLIALKY